MKQEKKEPLTWFKKQFSKEENPDKKKGKYPYLILVLLFGAGFMLVSNLFFNNDSSSKNLYRHLVIVMRQREREVETFGQKNSEGNSVIIDYERTYEAQLKEALDKIVGVEDVTVVVNVDATELKVFEKNTNTQSQLTDETDREGGKRKVEDQSTRGTTCYYSRR